jgi:hypothetical protein
MLLARGVQLLGMLDTTAVDAMRRDQMDVEAMALVRVTAIAVLGPAGSPVEGARLPDAGAMVGVLIVGAQIALVKRVVGWHRAMRPLEDVAGLIENAHRSNVVAAKNVVNVVNVVVNGRLLIVVTGLIADRGQIVLLIVVIVVIVVHELIADLDPRVDSAVMIDRVMIDPVMIDQRLGGKNADTGVTVKIACHEPVVQRRRHGELRPGLTAAAANGHGEFPVLRVATVGQITGLRVIVDLRIAILVLIALKVDPADPIGGPGPIDLGTGKTPEVHDPRGPIAMRGLTVIVNRVVVVG